MRKGTVGDNLTLNENDLQQSILNVKKIEILTKSAAETKEIGEILALQLLSETKFRTLRSAIAISLEGELGSGKTTFAQGFAKGLGIKENPRSPTFVIMRVYPVRSRARASRPNGLRELATSNGASFIHIDAYRIKSKDLKILGWEGLVNPSADGPQNIILIEWGNRVKNILPKTTIRIRFRHHRHQHQRLITINQ